MIRKLFIREKKNEHGFKKRHMWKLHRYVKKMVKRGFNKKRIEDALVKSGFPDEVIKVEMRELDMHLEKLDGKKAKSIKTCQPQTAIVKVSYAKDKAAKKDKPRNLTIKSKKSAITLKKSKQKVKRRGERMAKGVGQEQARHFLRDVVPEKNFWINSGPIVRNLEGLLGVLENLEDDKFSYHVNKDKNDFAVWIREVVEDNTLAKTAANAKTKNAMSKVLKERIDKLKRAAV